MFLSVSDGVGSPRMDDCEPWEPNLDSLEEKCAINCQAPYFRLYICMCTYLYVVCACEGMCLWMETRELGFSAARFTGLCEPLDKGADNQTWGFWNNSTIS